MVRAIPRNGEQTSRLDSTPELQRFAMQAFFPFAGLIAVTLLSLVALEFWSAGVANRHAVSAGQELAKTGLRLALLQVGSNVTATANWDDAVVYMHVQHDQDWAKENIGDWASAALHFEKVFIIDPKGMTRFGMIDGLITSIPIKAAFADDDLQTILGRVRAAPLGEAATGIVSAGEEVVMIGAAAIHPHTSNVPPITGGYSILVYGDVLDGAAVATLRDAYLLDDMQFVRGDPTGEVVGLPLVSVNGAPVGNLVWNPDRPGTRVLRVVLPVLAGLAIAIAVLATLILFYARSAAGALSLSRQLALTDSLTGLPNRILLEDRLQQAILGMDRSSSVVAVLCLDLDEFKSVNDLHGHAAGDEVLRQVAMRLRAMLRTADIISRIGGDEFVVVQTAPDEHAVNTLAERLSHALCEPIIFEGEVVQIGASIGIAYASGSGEISSDLLRRADRALYDAKREGGNRSRTVHLSSGLEGGNQFKILAAGFALG